MKFAILLSSSLLVIIFTSLSFLGTFSKEPEIDTSPKLEWHAGHRYIKFYGGAGTTFSYSYVHDPDCPNKKCDN